MSLDMFLCVLLFLLLTALNGNALNEKRGDKRLEEGASRNTSGSHRSSRQLNKGINNFLALVGNLLSELLNIATPPTAFDWRDSGWVSEVQDQYQCNSSWAFAAVGSVEFIYFNETDQLIALSAQQLIDCSLSLPYGNEGCGGGSANSAFKYIIDNGGIDSQNTYPYKATVGKCRFDAANFSARIKSYKVVRPRGSEVALLEAVKKQPVAVVVDASHDSFQNYTSGVYYEPLCSQTNVDQAMLVVGYGTNSQGEDYWIVKNSYGIGWGIDGYILMSRNRNNSCGIASNASYPVA